MELKYCCKVTYETGQIHDYNTGGLSVDIQQEYYQRIMLGIWSGKAICEIEGIDLVISAMEENILFIDRFYNVDGSRRSAPLKKSRAIASMEFYLPEREVQRIRKIKNPEAAFSRKKEKMTIYRSDDSFVEISSENGMVMIKDSRKNSQYIKMDADQFLRDIVRW